MILIKDNEYDIVAHYPYNKYSSNFVAKVINKSTEAEYILTLTDLSNSPYYVKFRTNYYFENGQYLFKLWNTSDVNVDTTPTIIELMDVEIPIIIGGEYDMPDVDDIEWGLYYLSDDEGNYLVDNENNLLI